MCFPHAPRLVCGSIPRPSSATSKIALRPSTDPHHHPSTRRRGPRRCAGPPGSPIDRARRSTPRTRPQGRRPGSRPTPREPGRRTRSPSGRRQSPTAAGWADRRRTTAERSVRIPVRTASAESPQRLPSLGIRGALGRCRQLHRESRQLLDRPVVQIAGDAPTLAVDASTARCRRRSAVGLGRRTPSCEPPRDGTRSTAKPRRATTSTGANVARSSLSLSATLDERW